MYEERTVLQETVDAVAKYGSITAAAREMGIPRKTLSGRYNKALDRGYSAGTPMLTPDQEIKLDSKLKSITLSHRLLRKKYEELLDMSRKQSEGLSNIEVLTQKISSVKHEQIKIISDGKPSESTAVIMCSDLHFEETVDPDTIDGLNEYNPKIAQARLRKVFQNGLKLIEMSRSKSNIKKLILWLGGDFIAGYIHEELMEKNSMSPIDASIQVYKLLVSSIDFLVENGKLDEIVVVTSVGNHARTTDKIRISTSVENNYEWLIYNFLESHYEKSDVVKFKLSRSYFNYLEVYGYMLRFHHGNYIRYGGGVGGITVPLNKAIAQWNQAKPVYMDIFGHWHQRISTKNAICNGSIIGYGPYAMSIKAAFERPQQSFFLMHPRWGRTLEAPIFVD